MSHDARGLQPVPTLGAVFGRQLRFLLWSRRGVYLTAALLLLLFLTGLFGTPPDVPRAFLVGLVGLPVGVIWATVVWQGENPSRRGYQWSQPVSRAWNDSARVAAGGIHLLAAYLVLALASVAWGAVDGTLQVHRDLGVGTWVGYFLSPLTIYVLTMPFVLWSEYRITHWLVGLSCFLPPSMILLSRLGITWPEERFVAVMVRDEWSLGSAVMGPLLGETLLESGATWPVGALIWIGTGVALTALAARFRPDDIRRAFAARPAAAA